MNTIFSSPRTLSALLGLSLLVAACDDPAKGKPQATVSEPIAAASASAPSATTTTYAITAQSSKIGWTGSKVTGKHEGTFDTFSGTIAWGGAIEKSSVNVDIDTTSIRTEPEMLLKHLKSADFFDVQSFPKASFASTSITPQADGSYEVKGNLALHGVTKSIAFPATITQTGDAVDAKATFSINRKDFGINYAGKANDLIRDEVVITLAIHGEKPRS